MEKKKFEDLKSLVLFLQKEGFQISLRTAYRHQKAGKIRPDKDGSFDLSAVNKYARNHLVLKSTRQKGKIEDLQHRKLRVELEVREEELKRQKFKNLLQEKKYILWEDVERQLAGRAIILEAGIKGAFTSQISELLGAAGGNPRNAEKLLNKLFEIFDDALNQFATPMTFEIEFDEE